MVAGDTNRLSGKSQILWALFTTNSGNWGKQNVSDISNDMAFGSNNQWWPGDKIILSVTTQIYGIGLQKTAVVREHN